MNSVYFTLSIAFFYYVLKNEIKWKWKMHYVNRMKWLLQMSLTYYDIQIICKLHLTLWHKLNLKIIYKKFSFTCLLAIYRTYSVLIYCFMALDNRSAWKFSNVMEYPLALVRPIWYGHCSLKPNNLTLLYNINWLHILSFETLICTKYLVMVVK